MLELVRQNGELLMVLNDWERGDGCVDVGKGERGRRQQGTGTAAGGPSCWAPPSFTALGVFFTFGTLELRWLNKKKKKKKTTL